MSRIDHDHIDNYNILPPRPYVQTHPLPPVQWRLPYIEGELTRHRQRNLRKPWFSRYGGLRILRLGRLTIQWSYRSR